MDNNMVLNTGFNELVFEHRNKAYGAYQIRRGYTRTVFLASLISISILSSGMILYFVTMPNAMAEIPKENSGGFKVITIENPRMPEQPKTKKVEQLKTQTPPKGPDVKALSTPNITQKVVETHPTDSTGTSSKGIVGGTGTQVDTTKNGCTNCVTKTDSVPLSPKRVEWVDTEVKDPGLDAFFRKNIRYPEVPKENGIEGTEILEFVIDIHGNPKEFKIAKSSNPFFAKEVLRVAPGMPKFEPIIFEGQPVELIMHKPIHFTLGK